jgi:hypothetical protein
MFVVRDLVRRRMRVDQYLRDAQDDVDARLKRMKATGRQLQTTPTLSSTPLRNAVSKQIQVAVTPVAFPKNQILAGQSDSTR